MKTAPEVAPTTVDCKPSVVPTKLNVEHEADLANDADFFLKWGYLIVSEALSGEQVVTLRSALSDTIARRKSEFVHSLLEEDDRFSFLLDYPPVFRRIKKILGTCVQLHSGTARVTTPGTADQHWHRDSPWPMDPDLTPYGSTPAQINCGYFLDDITAANGPTVLLPGSHRALFRPPDSHVKFPDEVHATVRAGTAVLFDGHLFHRGAANHSSLPRRVVLMCYQNAWMKSREKFDGPRTIKIREEGSSERKLLLGAMGSW